MTHAHRKHVSPQLRDDLGDGGFQATRGTGVFRLSDPRPKAQSGWELDNERFLAGAATKPNGTEESTEFVLGRLSQAS